MWQTKQNYRFCTEEDSSLFQNIFLSEFTGHGKDRCQGMGTEEQQGKTPSEDEDGVLNGWRQSYGWRLTQQHWLSFGLELALLRSSSES